jgi:cytochrome oxidase Cu insertion factor (SCO1/SenC/PrrC family)
MIERYLRRSSVLARAAVAAPLLLALVACGTQPETRQGGGPRPPIAEGQPAPGFTLQASNGQTMALQDFAGTRPVLFYFSMGPG